MSPACLPSILSWSASITNLYDPHDLAGTLTAMLFLLLLALQDVVWAEHHMKRFVEPRQSSNGSIPLTIVNQCSDTIYPGILTQGGTGPADTGFELKPGANRSLTVSSNWQGRVWGRTNCTFNGGGGRACQTGDCGGTVACKGTGEVPTTLAEFTLEGANDQAYYDISIVDGYNLPMAIVLVPNGIAALARIPPNETNPSCVGSQGNLAAQSYNPYNSGSQTFLGTNSSNQLPFDTSVTAQQVSNWCPWDLQVNPPEAPGAGVYPYPDSNIQRPIFNPCYSACAKYNDPKDCCTGQYNSASSCAPSYYSRGAKTICPDAYSYAYDDQDSTFVVPKGGGFQVILCPGGRSTRIIQSKSSGQVQHSGHMSMGMRNPFSKDRPMIDHAAPLLMLAIITIALI